MLTTCPVYGLVFCPNREQQRFRSLLGTAWFECCWQVIYLVGLLNAYKQGDVGVIYPIARALPVLMVGVGAWFIGQSLEVSAWIGFAILTLGCLLVPIKTFRQLTVSAYANLGVLWAFVAAIGTTIYQLSTKRG